MSNSIKPMAFLAGVGGVLGGAAGFFAGGPGLTADGAKIGLGLGVKVAAAQKAEEGIDAVGRKVENIVDAAQDRLIGAVEKIADTWATIMLCGYTWQIAHYGASLHMATFKEHCPGMFYSLDCLSLAATTFSINTVSTSASIALGMKMASIIKKEWNNLRG
jgi:hypothetical protein